MKKRYPTYSTDYIKAFGQNVRKLRLEKKYSQLQLAIIAEVEKNQIYRVEKGLHAPNLHTIIAIAIALGKQPAELLDFLFELPLNQDPQVPSTEHGESETTHLVRMLVYEKGFFKKYRKAGDVVNYYEEDRKLNSSAVSGALHTLWKKKVLERVPGKKKGTYEYRKVSSPLE